VNDLLDNELDIEDRAKLSVLMEGLWGKLRIDDREALGLGK
jgi:hypothetical protein